MPVCLNPIDYSLYYNKHFTFSLFSDFPENWQKVVFDTPLDGDIKADVGFETEICTDLEFDVIIEVKKNEMDFDVLIDPGIEMDIFVETDKGIVVDLEEC